jgi:hypothetical protein
MKPELPLDLVKWLLANRIKAKNSCDGRLRTDSFLEKRVGLLVAITDALVLPGVRGTAGSTSG